jgi:hypothetical protein
MGPRPSAISAGIAGEVNPYLNRTRQDQEKQHANPYRGGRAGPRLLTRRCWQWDRNRPAASSFNIPGGHEMEVLNVP